VTTVCEVLGLAQSTYYEKSTTKASDARLKKAIETIIMKRPYYGYQWITHELKRKVYVVSQKTAKRAESQLQHGESICSTSDSKYSLPCPATCLEFLKILNPSHVGESTQNLSTYFREPAYDSMQKNFSLFLLSPGLIF